VYAAHGSAVLGYLRRFVPHDDAEDVLQRVFYEVWRHQGRYDPSRSLAAWIFGIARERAIICAASAAHQFRSTACAVSSGRMVATWPNATCWAVRYATRSATCPS